jgi:MFS family permease
MPYWVQSFKSPGQDKITPSEDSLIVSILSAGTFFGALLAAPTADILGRKYGLMASAAIVFNLGVILQVASTTQPLFIAGRFFAGLGVGLISAIVPLYQSETAPKWIRGTIVGAYQWAITIVSELHSRKSPQRQFYSPLTIRGSSSLRSSTTELDNVTIPAAIVSQSPSNSHGV